MYILMSSNCIARFLSFWNII